MTRFMQQLNGTLGAFWQKEAEKELAEVKADLETGRITIDKDGIARNCIGRVLMSDMLEKLALVTNEVNVEATAAAREAEVAESINAYRNSRKPYSAEELAEMQAAFGEGATVTDIFTGEKIEL